jgi:hypothetical protein
VWRDKFGLKGVGRMGLKQGMKLFSFFGLKHIGMMTENLRVGGSIPPLAPFPLFFKQLSYEWYEDL